MLCAAFFYVSYYYRKLARLVFLVWPAAVPIFLVFAISELEKQYDVTQKGLIGTTCLIISLAFIALLFKIIGRLPPSN
jgi:NADH:ubiquinone oxidoreductase subunit 6 (subunit J)